MIISLALYSSHHDVIKALSLTMAGRKHSLSVLPSLLLNINSISSWYLILRTVNGYRADPKLLQKSQTKYFQPFMLQKYDRKYYVREMLRLHFQCKCGNAFVVTKNFGTFWLESVRWSARERIKDEKKKLIFVDLECHHVASLLFILFANFPLSYSWTFLL